MPTTGTNKIKYGLSKIHYAVATDNGTGTLTYAAPVEIPGARSLTLSASGDSTDWYADNVDYFSTTANNGYEGSFEVARLPESFRTDVLGEIHDVAGFYYEKADTTPKEFALLFEFKGDNHPTAYALYRCVVTRPDVSGSTQESSIEPQSETVNIKALPRINDGVVKGRCPATDTAYATWYTAVQEPTQ